MRSGIPRRFGVSAMAVVLATIGLPIVAGTSASAAVALQCTPSVSIFGVATDDGMWLNEHNEPESGANAITGRGRVDGGWQGRVLAGRNGNVHFLPGNGDLKRWHWNGTSFDNPKTLATGRWYGWSDPANTNRITIDANDHFYNVLGNGTLELNIYNESANTWTTRALASDWGKYDLIFAAGNGVIYARDPAIGGGTLFRYQYDAANERWLGFNRQLSGGGWNIHRQIFSPGGDIVYGINKDTGQLAEYRYDPHTNTWPLGYAALSTGWGGIRNASATTNSCSSTTPTDTVTQCTPSVSIFGVGTDNGMWLNEHNEPETGTNDFRGRGRVDGGWTGRVLAGRDGDVFFLPGNGELRRWRWNGTSFVNPETLATGWSTWNEPTTINRITVDANNNFYNVQSSGALEINIYNETSKTWAARTLATDWGKYDLIFASGNGVIYARDKAIGDGTLFRYQYDAATQRWLSYNQQVAGGGWNIHRQVFSPGGDIVYGINKDTGQLIEYRYDPQSNTWPVGYAPLTTGWSGIRNASAVTNNCSLLNQPTITRPTVAAPNNERAQMIYNGTANRLEIFYVDNNGILRRGYQSSPGTEVLEWQALSGYQGYTGRATAAQRQDGRVLVLGHSASDADTRSHTQNAAGSSTWVGPNNLSGAFASSPTVLKGAGDLLNAFAVDSAGQLWSTQQFATDSSFLPWRKAASANPYQMSNDYAVVRSGSDFEIAYRGAQTATVAVAKFSNGTLAAPRTAPGVTAAGIPSAVVYSDGKVQLVTRDVNGAIQTQKETANGFSGWIDISGGQTYQGSPAVLLNVHGIVEVAARTTDGTVYRTGQTAPGSTSWRIWTTNLDSSSVDPVFTAAAGNEQRIFYLEGGNYYLLQATAYTSDGASGMTATSARQTRTIQGEATTGKV